MNYNIKDGKLHLMIDKETVLADLLEYLCISRKNRYLLISDKKLLLNGAPVKNTDVTMQRNDRLSFILDEYQPDYAPADSECKVVWEDELLYIFPSQPVSSFMMKGIPWPIRLPAICSITTSRHQ